MTISFEEVTQTAGISYSGLTFGAAWGDFNGDDLPDLWVNNHFNNQGILYQNEGDGTFTDVTLDVFLATELEGDDHGSAWIDIDNDGDQDLIQVGGGDTPTPDPRQANNLYINEGGQLRDQAVALGVDYPLARAQSPIVLDFDNDGLLDILLGATPRSDGLGPPTVFRQRSAAEGGGFEDVGILVGFQPQVGEASRWGILSDLSGDGQLDIILEGARTILDPQTIPFTDLTSTLLASPLGAADAAAADFNGDLLPDLYLTSNSGITGVGLSSPDTARTLFTANTTRQGIQFNTGGEVEFTISVPSNVPANRIFIGSSGFNPSSNQFTLSPDDPTVVGIVPNPPGTGRAVYIGYDPTLERWQVFASAPSNFVFTAIAQSTEPIENLSAIGFVDRPARPDRLLVNTGQGLIDESQVAGLGDIPVDGKSVAAGDFDNDMDVDLYIVASDGAVNSPNVLLDNQGDGTFVPVEFAGGAAGSNLGLGESVVAADYNLDGFLDLFVTNGFVPQQPLPDDGPHQLFRNLGNENHWLLIDLEGVQSNRDGIGARVLVTAGGVTQLREQNGGIHKWSQHHQRLHFGLGTNTVIDEIEITWPSGIIQRIQNIAADQLFTIVETDSSGITINGTPDDDVLDGTAAEDIINGLDGNDFIRAAAGNDLLNGNAGHDRLNGGTGDDTIRGGNGNDRLFGEQGNDILVGGLGQDILIGGSGDDIFDFNDVVESAVGAGDTIRFFNRNPGDQIDLSDITRGIGRFIGINNFTGAAGQVRWEVMGADSLVQLDANGDSIADLEIVLFDADGPLTGSDFLLGQLEMPAPILGTDRNDTLEGTDGDDVLDGGLGNDLLRGNDGNDRLIGGAGRDIMFGLNGNDTLLGNQGDDVFWSGPGNDRLRGGEGNDLFRLVSPEEGPDIITDFQSGADLIQVTLPRFQGGLLSGFLREEQFVLGTEATTAEHRFIYDRGTGDLFFDVDGGVDGSQHQVLIAQLANLPTLQASDIRAV